MTSERANWSELLAEIESPEVVAKIDSAMADVQRELLELADLRKIAVRRHGDRVARYSDLAIGEANCERPPWLRYPSEKWAISENGALYPRRKPWLKV